MNPPPLLRRQVLAALLAALLAAGCGIAGRPAQALPARPLRFPRDHGAHPEMRTEWWYITGQGRSPADGREFGFQVTFFRSRVDEAAALRSAFAARQLVFAHAAVTDLQGGRLLHDQRIARAGFGIAGAAEDDTRVHLRDWQLVRQSQGSYTARLPAEGFALDLRFSPTQPLLLQGDQGLSRKGPEPRQASYYYSQPQLEASGRIAVADRWFELSGRAWLDHEFSEELLHPDAVGWDWIGINLDDGSALTAFQLRRADGSALWDGGSYRPAGRAQAQAFGAGQARLVAGRAWTSPATGTRYPVEWTLDCPAGRFVLRARLDAQELDSRTSTGSVYWEGLSELLDAQGRRVGSGYLEMTGYHRPLRI